uniref:Transmembrane protein n=1 Tax=Acrobeloides nanus TaxID=290746 RepID=A0A914DMV9_9BILA
MFSLISITILLSLVGVNGQNLHNFDYLINQALPFLKSIQKVSLDSQVCPQANNTALLDCFNSYYKNYNFVGVNSTDNKLVDPSQLVNFVKDLKSYTTDQQNFNTFTKCYMPLSQCLYVSNLATIVETTSTVLFNDTKMNAMVYALLITAGEYYYQNPPNASALACAENKYQQIAKTCDYTAAPSPLNKFILDNNACTFIILNLDKAKYYCLLSAFATTCNASSEAGTLLIILVLMN